MTFVTFDTCDIRHFKKVTFVTFDTYDRLTLVTFDIYDRVTVVTFDTYHKVTFATFDACDKVTFVVSSNFFYFTYSSTYKWTVILFSSSLLGQLVANCLNQSFG